jgi:ssDNA-binding Zn-finger/Zn-ribbon topoisomerase 1
MMMTIFWIVMFVAVAFIVLCKITDRFYWNGGKCPKCGKEWKTKENLRRGELLCTCEQCHYSVVIDKEATKPLWR